MLMHANQCPDFWWQWNDIKCWYLYDLQITNRVDSIISDLIIPKCIYSRNLLIHRKQITAEEEFSEGPTYCSEIAPQTTYWYRWNTTTLSLVYTVLPANWKLLLYQHVYFDLETTGLGLYCVFTKIMSHIEFYFIVWMIFRIDIHYNCYNFKNMFCWRVSKTKLLKALD